MQMSLVDFSGCPELISDLDGNAQKTRIVYDGDICIMKYGNPMEPDSRRPMQGSYNHAPVAEHIGCRVFSALGIPVQDTLIGTFNGHEVVVCKDFVVPLGPDKALVQFSSIENSMVSSSERKRSPKLRNLERVYGEHPFFEGFREQAMPRYWDMFVGDAIIGNFDRHTGNWGFIADVDPVTRVPERMHSFAPIYDCGSSLAARLSESAMAEIGSDENALRARALGFPNARLILDGNDTVGYRELLMSESGKDAREAVLRLAFQIRSLDVDALVDSVPGISDVRRNFYKATLRSRIEHIVQPAYGLACRERGIRQSSIVPGKRTVSQALQSGSLP